MHVGKREAQCLDERVEPLDAPLLHLVKVDDPVHPQRVDNPQRDERRQPAPVRRALVHRQLLRLAVRVRDGLDKVGRVRRQVLEGHDAAARHDRVDNLLRHLALVERVLAFRAEAAQRPAEVGVGEELARPRRLAVDQERVRAAALLLRRDLLEARLKVDPLVRAHLVHGEAVLCERDRRRQHLGERELAPAKARLDVHEARRRAGHGYGVGVLVRDALARDAELGGLLEAQRLRAPPRAVDRAHAPLLGIPEEREEVAADTGVDGLTVSTEGKTGSSPR